MLTIVQGLVEDDLKIKVNPIKSRLKVKEIIIDKAF